MYSSGFVAVAREDKIEDFLVRKGVGIGVWGNMVVDWIELEVGSDSGRVGRQVSGCWLESWSFCRSRAWSWSLFVMVFRSSVWLGRVTDGFGFSLY